MSLNYIKGIDIDAKYKGFDFNTKKLNLETAKVSGLVIGESGGGKRKRKIALAKLSNAKAIESGEQVRGYIGQFPEETIEKVKIISSKKENNNSPQEIITKNNLKISITDFLTLDAVFRGKYLNDTSFFRIISKGFEKYSPSEIRGENVVLDGFIRKASQVYNPKLGTGILDIIKNLGFNEIGYVVLTQADPSYLKIRTLGRRVCDTKRGGCGRDYNPFNGNKESIPKNLEFEIINGGNNFADNIPRGYCFDCNLPLYQRDDDKPEAIENRLNEFKNNIIPVLEALVEKNIKLYVVSGNIKNYSQEGVNASVNNSLNCRNELVLNELKTGRLLYKQNLRKITKIISNCRQK